MRGSLLARLFLLGRRIRLHCALVFDKDSDSRSPAHCRGLGGGGVFPVSMTCQWWERSGKVVMAVVEINHCTHGWSDLRVSFFLFFLQGVSSVFKGRRRWPEMKNDVVSGLGDRFSIWSSKVQQFLIGPLGRIAAPFTRLSLDLNHL